MDELGQLKEELRESDEIAGGQVDGRDEVEVVNGGDAAVRQGLSFNDLAARVGKVTPYHLRAETVFLTEPWVRKETTTW